MQNNSSVLTIYFCFPKMQLYYKNIIYANMSGIDCHF